MAYGLVYKITNSVNGKLYVGQTVQSVLRRWKSHRKNARDGKSWPLSAAIRKYGADNFTVTTLAHANDKDELNALEVKYIAELRPHYNACAGGGGLGRPSEEVRLKMSASHKVRCEKFGPPATGNKWSEEHKKYLSGINTGARNRFYGKSHTDETREKMRLAHANRPLETCPKCGKTGIYSNMKRWHFDNCRWANGDDGHN